MDELEKFNEVLDYIFADDVEVDFQEKKRLILKTKQAEIYFYYSSLKDKFEYDGLVI